MSELQLIYVNLSTFQHDVYNMWIHRRKNVLNMFFNKWHKIVVS